MWELFKDFIFQIINFFYGSLQDWGMAIIVVTILFRLLIAPLMHSQTKSSYQMQKMQPKIQEIQQRFADDPVRQQQEVQKIYAEAKSNPLAGCVPMLLQMPIFIALFQVLRNMQDYIPNFDSITYEFYNLVPDLVQSPSSAWEQGLGVALPYFVLLIIFAGATFLPMLLQQRNNSNSSQQTQMYIMAAIMSVMMLWIGWGSPAGVLLFWGTSSLLGLAQTQLTTRALKAADEKAEDEIEVKPVQVEVTRKAKKKRPTKKH